MGRLSPPGGPPPVGCREALEFVRFLSLAEGSLRAALGRAGAASSEDAPSEDEEEDDVRRGKVSAYSEELRARLLRWSTLDEAAAEEYRSRIEKLVPALDASLDRRRAARAAGAAAAPAPPSQGGAGPGRAEPPAPRLPAVAPSLEQRMAARAAEKAQREAAAAAAAGAEAAERGAAADGAGSQEPPGGPLPAAPPPGAAGGPAAAEVELPWRRPRGGGAARWAAGSAGAAGMRGQIEEDMVGMADAMKSVAEGFGATLREDNRRLQEINSTVGQNLDKVQSETDKGKKMLRSGRFSFLCEMVMVATSVVIFFMMIPFIVFT